MQTSHLKMLFLAVLALVLAWTYEQTPLYDEVETRVALPLLFRMREALGQSPKLDPRLKIFTYDDSTFSSLHTAEPSLEQWVRLLEDLDARRPRYIFIDKIFALTPLLRGADDTRAALLARLGRLHTPVVTAAFVSPQPIQQRQRLDLGRPEYDLKRYFPSRRALLQSSFPPLSPRLGWYAYGPESELMPYFRRLGHVLNSGFGFADALLRLDSHAVLLHLALLGSDDATFDRGALMVDGTKVAMDRQGRIVVDFSAPAEYYRHSHRLLKVLLGGEQPNVRADDVVLILPAMFTGSTDFAETPVGQLPGGFVIASLLNSRLQKAWIEPVSGLSGPLWVGLLLGGLAALASGYWIAPTLIGAVTLQLGAGILLFAYGRAYAGLSGPFFALLATAGLLLAERYRIRERALAVMRLLKSENEALQYELERAGEISRAFIPAGAPTWPDFAIGTYHRPLSGASGDWYAFERAESGRYLHFLMCDISGHGAQAAIIVSTCKTVLSMMVVGSSASLENAQFAAHYAQRLNDTLCLNGGGNHTTTFLGLTFDVETRHVYCLCSGHPRPVRLSGGQARKPAYIGVHSTLLGILPELRFEAARHDLEPGDAILAFTDGVPFPRSSEKIGAIFAKYRHLDPDSAAKYMTIEARERALDYGRPIDDDISLVCFRWGSLGMVRKAG